jgi:cysteine synthase A
MKPSIANSVLELVGNTPLLRINKLNESQRATVYAKCENFNPSSIKDRPAISMIQEALAVRLCGKCAGCSNARVKTCARREFRDHFVFFDYAQEGKLKPGMEIVETSSGNTAIGLAQIGALYGRSTSYFDFLFSQRVMSWPHVVPCACTVCALCMS